MKKWEKEILQKQVTDESRVTMRLESAYKSAIDQIDDKIQLLKSKDQTQSVIYQVKYQEALKSQVENVYTKMAGTYYDDINSYLKDCYEDSFYSTMYGLHQEGIPLIIPFNQEEAAQAAAQDFGVFGNNLSQKLYDDVYKTASVTVGRITRGIAMNSSYASMALDVAKTGTATLNQALRIVRTEGHRINQEVQYQTINKVKGKGADVVKQWDSSIDKRTRPSHAALDGQLREIEQPFKSPTNGHTAQYPGGFGIASEDINCRCVSLQRARWALDKSELDKYVGNLDGMTDNQLDELAAKLGVSKEDLIKKSNGIIESDGSINHSIKAQNYNQFKKKYKTKEAAQKAQEVLQDENELALQKLQDSLTNEQEKLKLIQNKTYSGIWKDDISVSDYKFKKDSIQAKKDWYLQQIANTSDTAKIAQYQKYIDDLDEFADLGAKYESIDDEILRIRGEIRKATPTSAAFSQERKDNALWFDKKNGGFSAADKYFDPPSKSIHSSATSAERDGFYTYTSSSGGHNRPLAGFQKPYHESGTGWEEKYFVGSKKVWIDYEGKGDQIRGLTTLIEKSTYADDVWLQSGQNFSTVEGFLNVPYGTLKKMSDADLQQYVGRKNVINNFLSSAVNEGGGAMFNGLPLKLNIYAPQGSQMLYASDVGAFGKGENEMILQRGGTYEITKMYWGKDATDGNTRKIFVDMELHSEEGYDLFQQDPSEWTGLKNNYRN